MFDELILDDADRVRDGDPNGLLWALATAGAQVRRTLETARSDGLRELGESQRPRAVLVCTDAGGAQAARAVVRLACANAPTILYSGVDLPRWAGPADAMLISTLDDMPARLGGLLDQARRRGLTIAAAAPARSLVAVGAGRDLIVELVGDLHPRAARWSVLTPMLMCADAMGLLAAAPSQLEEVADALDAAAQSCGPSLDVYTNRAKALAIALNDCLPVIAGAGVLASVAAGIAAESLHLIAGSPAVALSLPDGLATAASLLRTPATESFDDSFFRDRLDDQPMLRPGLVTIGDDGDPLDPALGEHSDAQVQLDEFAARNAAATLRDIAESRGLRTSMIEAPTGSTLARFAAASAFADFAAAYLAIGRGIDPSERAPGESYS
jgi:glucose/mannose-6-phosphate isomerase